MCLGGGGGSSAPATTPLPTQAATNDGNGQAAIDKAPTETTVDTPSTDTGPTDPGTSSLRIKRSKGGKGTSDTGTGLNIPT
jgi:hypothetical protein